LAPPYKWEAKRATRERQDKELWGMTSKVLEPWSQPLPVPAAPEEDEA
jgi:hypothetical protein